MSTFLSCDWGTSTFRLRLVDTDKKEISGEIISDEGIAKTYQQWLETGGPEIERIHYYKNKLNDSISKLPGTVDMNTPVILSGMVSSSIGLLELPYQKFPFTWDVSRFVIKKIEGDEKYPHPLFIVSGFKTDDDVMRGEETLLLGCEAGDDSEKIYIFPGSHSKHVFIKNKTGVDFKTYMTGEIFSLLAEKSIIRNAVRQGMDEEAFADGFHAAMEENILHSVFLVRTRQLLQQKTPISNYQYLSGLLIGTELRELRGNNCAVYLVCSEHLKQPYLAGLELLDITRGIYYLNADDMLLRAHCKIADQYL
jgi:2-dehydro-3-deoxygalactonokinase